MTRTTLRRSLIAVSLTGLAAVLTAVVTAERWNQPAMSPTLRLHVRPAASCGERALLLLHGLGGSGGYFVNRAASMGDDFELRAPDLLGFGLSPKPLDASYSVDEHADALLATVGDELEGRRTTIVGHSFGAVLALALAERRPDLFERAVLVSLPVFENRADGERHARRLGAMEAGILDDSALWRASCQLHALYRVPAAARLWGVPEDVYLDGTRHVWESLSRTLDNVLDVDAGALATRAQRRVPLVFVHGRADDIAPTAHVVALAHRLDARLVLLRGGHQVFLEDPERDEQVVRDESRAQDAQPVAGDWVNLTSAP
jgi:pimeloyl-ACP methyl ester carboxylesterase